MAPLLIGGISLGMGILNWLSGKSERSQQEENLRQIIGILEEQKITPNESRTNADMIGDYFNTTTVNALNNSSVGLAIGGVLNPESVKTKIASTLLGDKERALIDQKLKEEQINRDISLKEAQVKASMPIDKGIEDFVGGAVSGLNLAFSTENLINTINDNKMMSDYFDEIFNTGAKAPVSGSKVNPSDYIFRYHGNLVGILG